MRLLILPRKGRKTGEARVKRQSLRSLLLGSSARLHARATSGGSSGERHFHEYATPSEGRSHMGLGWSRVDFWLLLVDGVYEAQNMYQKMVILNSMEFSVMVIIHVNSTYLLAIVSIVHPYRKEQSPTFKAWRAAPGESKVPRSLRSLRCWGPVTLSSPFVVRLKPSRRLLATKPRFVECYKSWSRYYTSIPTP
jgi:hypothetical protein